MPIKYSYCFTAASVGSLLLSDLILGCLYHPFTLIGALALECLFVGSRAGFTMRPRSIKASLAPACSFVAVLFCSVLRSAWCTLVLDNSQLRFHGLCGTKRVSEVSLYALARAALVCLHSKTLHGVPCANVFVFARHRLCCVSIEQMPSCPPVTTPVEVTFAVTALGCAAAALSVAAVAIRSRGTQPVESRS